MVAHAAVRGGRLATGVRHRVVDALALLQPPTVAPLAEGESPAAVVLVRRNCFKRQYIRYCSSECGIVKGKYFHETTSQCCSCEYGYVKGKYFHQKVNRGIVGVNDTVNTRQYIEVLFV